MASEGRKKQGQSVVYKRSMSKQLHMAVVKVNTRVGKSSRPHYMSVSHSTQAQANHHIYWWASRCIWRESKGKGSKIWQAGCIREG